jgi:hypothetical protein
MNKQSKIKETENSNSSKRKFNPVKKKKTWKKKLEIDVDDILFSQDSISSKFKDGTSIEEAISNIKSEKIKISNFPAIIVIKIGDDSDPDYVSIDNRRLYIFQQALKWKRNKKIKVIVVNANDIMKITKFGKVTYQDDLDRKNTSKNNGETIKVRDGSPWYKIRKGRNGGEYIYNPATYKRVYVSQLSKTAKEKILKKIEADKLEESENLKQNEPKKEKDVKKNDQKNVIKGSEKLKEKSKINQGNVKNVEKRDNIKKEPKNQISKAQTLPSLPKNQHKIQQKNIVNSEKKDDKKKAFIKEKTVVMSRKEQKPIQQSKNKPKTNYQIQTKKLLTSAFEKTQKNNPKQTEFPVLRFKSDLNDESPTFALSDFLSIESDDEESFQKQYKDDSQENYRYYEREDLYAQLEKNEQFQKQYENEEVYADDEKYETDYGHTQTEPYEYDYEEEEEEEVYAEDEKYEEYQEQEYEYYTDYGQYEEDFEGDSDSYSSNRGNGVSGPYGGYGNYGGYSNVPLRKDGRPDLRFKVNNHFK